MSTITFFILVGLIFITVSFIAILDAASREYGSQGKKAAWIFVAAIPFIGWIIYLFTGFRYGKKPGKNGE
jgi:membrane-bound acyltransferase YfiQ involved in biofilm formation